MTTADFPAIHIPEWTQGDRMKKALRDIGLGVQEMATYLGVSRGTVGNWLADDVRVPGPSLKLFALRCGVPVEWIKSGSPEITPPTVRKVPGIPSQPVILPHLQAA